jgi:hypothetical protein
MQPTGRAVLAPWFGGVSYSGSRAWTACGAWARVKYSAPRRRKRDQQTCRSPLRSGARELEGLQQAACRIAPLRGTAALPAPAGPPPWPCAAAGHRKPARSCTPRVHLCGAGSRPACGRRHVTGEDRAYGMAGIRRRLRRLSRGGRHAPRWRRSWPPQARRFCTVRGALAFVGRTSGMAVSFDATCASGTRPAL